MTFATGDDYKSDYKPRKFPFRNPPDWKPNPGPPRNYDPQEFADKPKKPKTDAEKDKAREAAAKAPPQCPFKTPLPDTKYRSRIDLLSSKRTVPVPGALELPPRPQGKRRAHSASPARAGTLSTPRGRGASDPCFHINPHVSVSRSETPRGRKRAADASAGMWSVLSQGPPIAPVKSGRRHNSEPGTPRPLPKGKLGTQSVHPYSQSSLVCSGGALKPGMGEGEARTGGEDARGSATQPSVGFKKGDGAFNEKHRESFDITVQERGDYPETGSAPRSGAIRTGYAGGAPQMGQREDPRGRKAHPSLSERYASPRSCNPNRSCSRPRPQEVFTPPPGSTEQFRAKYLQKGKRRSRSAVADSHLASGGADPGDAPPFVPQKRQLDSPARDERADDTRPPVWTHDPRPRLLWLKPEIDKKINKEYNPGKTNRPIWQSSREHRKFYPGEQLPGSQHNNTDRHSLSVVREQSKHRSMSPVQRRHLQPPEVDNEPKHMAVSVHPPDPRSANHLRLPNAKQTDAEKSYKPGKKTTIYFPDERGKRFWHAPNQPQQAQVNTDAASLTVTKAPYRTEWGAMTKPRYVLPASPEPVVSAWEKRREDHATRHGSEQHRGGYSSTAASRSQTQFSSKPRSSNPQQEHELQRLRRENDTLLSRLRAFTK